MYLDVNRIFDDLFFYSWPRETTTSFVEDGDGYVCSLDIPGAKKDDISVTQEGYRVNVKWSRRGKEGSLALRAPTTTEETTAKYEDGVLTIRVKKREKEQGRKVKVE